MSTEEALQKIEGLLDDIADAMNNAAVVNECNAVADYIGDAEYAVSSVSKCVDEIAAELRDDGLRVLMQQWHEAQETEGKP